MALDERCVEYPWLLANLQQEPKILLDAGSTLNHDFILDHSILQHKTVHILTLAPEKNCFWEKGISYMFHDLRQIPTQDEYYDVIVCSSTLEHVGCNNVAYTNNNSHHENNLDDFAIVMQELRRVLKSRGRLLITVPFGVYQNFGTFQQFDQSLLDARH